MNDLAFWRTIAEEEVSKESFVLYSEQFIQLSIRESLLVSVTLFVNCLFFPVCVALELKERYIASM